MAGSALRSYFISVLMACILFMGVSAAWALPDEIPSYYRLPAGSWQEKSGLTLLKIQQGNEIQLAFTGVHSGTSCRIDVFSVLRSQFMARPGDCSQLQYSILNFSFEKDQLILTLINPGENFRELIFVKEGTVQDAPAI